MCHPATYRHTDAPNLYTLSLVLWIKQTFTLPKDMVHFYSQQKAFERTLFQLCRRQQVLCPSESSHSRVENPVLLHPSLGSKREYCSLSLGHFKVAFYLVLLLLRCGHLIRWIEKWQRRSYLKSEITDVSTLTGPKG